MPISLSIFAFDINDGRHYYLVQENTDKHSLVRTGDLMPLMPEYLNSGVRVPAPLDDGETRYAISAHGGKILTIKQNATLDYEIKELPVPRMFRPRNANTPDPTSALHALSTAVTPVENKPTRAKLCPIDEELLTKAKDELFQMTGLDDVKAAIISKVSYARGQRELYELGENNLDDIALHLVLTGNPGTGKTTVARIYGKFMRALGFLEKGDLIECGKKDLVAGYVGQTSIKTGELVDTAIGNVLYIDEAHGLLPKGELDFTPEALQELTKRMEDDRHQLVVVLSGYDEGLRELVRTTKGFRSRFKSFIEHKDYSLDDLGDIFNTMVEQRGAYLAPGAHEQAMEAIAARKAADGKDFENAREVRNIIENALERKFSRLFPDGQAAPAPTTEAGRQQRLIELKTLIPEDFAGASYAFSEAIKPAPFSRGIGFLADHGPAPAPTNQNVSGTVTLPEAPRAPARKPVSVPA